MSASSVRKTGWWQRWGGLSPSIGVHIGAGQLAVVNVQPGAHGLQRLSSIVDTLPEGVVVPSPIEPNICHPEVLIERLRSARRGRGVREVALSLPDPTVRVAILDLAHVPEKRAEREAIFRHHLEQLFLNTLGECRFTHQPLVPSASGHQRILVSAIREDILDEYEQVVRAADLLPAVVDISSFHLYNLYKKHIARVLDQPTQSALFLNMFDQNFTIVQVRRDGPRFIRVKAIQPSTTDADLVTRVMAEIDSSIGAAHGDENGLESVSRLFVFSDRQLLGLDREMADAYQVPTERLPLNGHVAAGANGGTVPQSGEQSDTDDQPIHDSSSPLDHPAVEVAYAAAIGWREEL